MDPQLKQQLRQVLSYATGASLDFAGQLQVGSVATVFSRVEPRFREVPVGGQVEERTNHFVALDSDWGVTEEAARNALYWLPGVSTGYVPASTVAELREFWIAAMTDYSPDYIVTYVALSTAFSTEAEMETVTNDVATLVVPDFGAGEAATVLATVSGQLVAETPADVANSRRAKIVHYCYGEFGELDHIELVI